MPNQESWDALRQHNELILNAAGEGIYGLDLHGRTTFANPAAAMMTGHTVSELIGEPMHEVVHHSRQCGEHYDQFDCPIYAALRDGFIRNVCDEVFWRKDGTCFPVEYTSTPIHNSGKIVGAVVVFRDISIRKETEERLRSALEEVRSLKERLQEENRALRRRIESTKFPQILGSSSALARVLELLSRAAATDSTVLVQGETGTGKELVARALHDASPRREGPIVCVNCGAISDHLVESELFGHERGAFTGAERRRIGRFEQANGGTLFLDEVGELSLDAQVRLLRALQERQIERVGGAETIQLDVRVVAATNRNLRQLVAAGKFRMDLFYRLNVVPIEIPPLRDRVEDIPQLVEFFLTKIEKDWNRHLGRPTPQGTQELLAYGWPGNVRELQNVIERAALESDGRRLNSFQEYFQHFCQPVEEPSALSSRRPTVRTEELRVPDEPIQSLGAVEREHILRALRECRWRISGAKGAAAALGLHPNTLRYRMNKLGISRTD